MDAGCGLGTTGRELHQTSVTPAADEHKSKIRNETEWVCDMQNMPFSHIRTVRSVVHNNLLHSSYSHGMATWLCTTVKKENKMTICRRLENSESLIQFPPGVSLIYPPQHHGYLGSFYSTSHICEIRFIFSWQRTTNERKRL